MNLRLVASANVGFDDFWIAYPRKVAKGAARRAFTQALKLASAEEIIAGAQTFAQHVRSEQTEPKYIPHPATWLNGERWDDELESTGWGEMDDF